MEATRPQLSRQISQQSVLSETSTIAPSAMRLGPAPTLAGLRQFAAKLGVKIPAQQNKSIDKVDAKSSFKSAAIQMPVATHQVRLAAPSDLEKNIGDGTSTIVGIATSQRSPKMLILQGVVIGVAGSGVVTGLVFAGLEIAKSIAANNALCQTVACF